MLRGTWFVVENVVRGTWCMVCGVWYVVRGKWCVVRSCATYSEVKERQTKLMIKLIHIAILVETA